jgi:hypothetical protein
MFHSIHVNYQTSLTNTVFNYNINNWKLLHGNEYVEEYINGIQFYLKPQVFRQANLDFFESGIIPFIASNIYPNR